MGLGLSVINESAEKRVSVLKKLASKDNILVHEIFASIQGESTFAGLPCIFVRTAGCHLRCRYCDTAHAFHDGREYSVDEVVNKVMDLKISLVEITGGEPLLQPSSRKLINTLCERGLTVLVETSGTVSIRDIDHRAHVILDIKTPGSGEHKRNVYSNLENLWSGCEVKFVICDKEDYDFAKEITKAHDLPLKCTVLFSPEADSMDKAQLAEWIVRDKLDVRFQIQLHKVLWGDKTGV